MNLAAKGAFLALFCGKLGPNQNGAFLLLRFIFCEFFVRAILSELIR